ncbi:DNA-directed RNA polymerase ii subunit rpb9-like protein [Trifolium pratense]|uniref:DNA-directed RNA polymerase ii subunit rpb9-like protein n=1 Tax=Trifolium pratense TaxID=57577 RepID=A0A2K3LJR9_TRIPR|nr:DNA-directed RNA polymerase ii subunit rpb9-like protein [Trifolium pratense]
MSEIGLCFEVGVEREDHFLEAADNFCVYRNEIHHSVAERTQVLQDVAADPTLPRTKAVRCGQCSHGEAVFFQMIKGKRGCNLDFVFELEC